MRGIALYEDKVIFQSAGRLIALNARTGELEWDVPMQGSRASSSGPLVANGLVLEGMGGCRRTKRTSASSAPTTPTRASSAGAS